eukprot:UN13141
MLLLLVSCNNRLAFLVLAASTCSRIFPETSIYFAS